MTHGRDAFLCAFAAARAKWIGSNIYVAAAVVLIGEPCLIASLHHALQANDATGISSNSSSAPAFSARSSLRIEVTRGERKRCELLVVLAGANSASPPRKPMRIY